MRPTTCLASGLLLASVHVALPASQSPARDVALDHLILGIDDLERGIAEFTRLTGLEPQRGGQHPGRGTENALISLGDESYLEILAPTPASRESSTSAWPTRLTPSGWALRAANLAAVLGRLREASFEVVGPIAGSRKRADGSVLQWQSGGARGSGLERAPFFIQWSADTKHPSATSPGGCRLGTFEVTAPDPKPLEAFFAAARYRAVVKTGPSGMRMTLQCPKGEVSFAP